MMRQLEISRAAQGLRVGKVRHRHGLVWEGMVKTATPRDKRRYPTPWPDRFQGYTLHPPITVGMLLSKPPQARHGSDLTALHVPSVGSGRVGPLSIRRLNLGHDHVDACNQA
jgi:hypothetical protein